VTKEGYMSKKKRNSKEKELKAKAGKSPSRTAADKPSAKSAKKEKKRTRPEPAADGAPQEFDWVEVSPSSVLATPMWQGQFLMKNGDLLTATVIGFSMQQGGTLFDLVVLAPFGGTTQRRIAAADIDKAYARLPKS
jgi:hypothetical protein